MISWWISVLVLLNTFMFQTNGANILGLFSTPSKSHVIIHKSLMQELAGNGHNVRFLIIVIDRKHIFMYFPTFR